LAAADSDATPAIVKPVYKFSMIDFWEPPLARTDIRGGTPT
jgi:hypothetical protein